MGNDFNEMDTVTRNNNDIEHYPIEPNYHPIHRATRLVYDFLASAKLAMLLLVAILACSLAGVTIIREKQAWENIFNTLWFNGLLILLVINVACCFFGRIWGRRVTLISFGMILFHLSFVTLFLGIIYNSLFYFRGTIRMTEGETLPNSDPLSYDEINKGRFFDFKALSGEASLIKMHTAYKAEGMDKRAAYEVEIRNGAYKKREKIYVTKHLDNRGVKYFPDKEGYSLLTVMYDTGGRELYGAYVPLQSLRNALGELVYTTGSKDRPAAIPYPPAPAIAKVNMNVTYLPDKELNRGGEAYFDLYPAETGGAASTKPFAAGRAKIGEKIAVGSLMMSAKEVRYWTAMAVRYEPGQPIILTSLWVGLFGTTLTTLARMFKKRKN